MACKSWRWAASLLVALPILADAASVDAKACATPGPASARGVRLAAIALQEYREFNGHRIDARGRLWKFGSVETETENLHDNITGDESARVSDRFAWRRVWHYWQTLDQHQPGVAFSRRIKWVPDLLDNRDSAVSAQFLTLAKAFKGVAEADELVLESLVRAAIADSPWSGAFISYLMHEAQLSDTEFRYSGAHASYIRPALEGTEAYAYRACDPLKTMPRVGDLLCYSRGDVPYRDFADWLAHSEELSGQTKSHCDLVVMVDPAAKKIETVGGNVLQAVTRRQLMLDQNNTLSRRHLATQRAPHAACRRDVTCRKADLNIQYWGVLLQLR